MDLQALSPKERLEAIARRLEEIAATLPDTAYLELLWRGVKLCAESCEKETSDWVWRNLSLFAYRVATSYPTTYSYDEAILVHRLAIEEVPEANAYTRLSDLLQLRGDTEEAYDATTQATTQESTDTDVLTELGRQHHNAKNWAASLEAFEKAYSIDSNNDGALNNMIYLRKRVCKWDSLDALAQRLAMRTHAIHKAYFDGGDAVEGVRSGQVNAHPWVFLYLPFSAYLKRRTAEMYNTVLSQNSAVLSPSVHSHAAVVEKQIQTLRKEYAQGGGFKRRLRVGFVSSDFRRKATSYLCHRLFEHFDREVLEVFIYATYPDEKGGSEWVRVIRKGAEHFVDLHKLPVEKMVDRMRKDKPDILLDMDGYANEGERVNTLSIARIAPIQIMYFVYMGTLGSKYIDYIITDNVATPPHLALAHTEKLLVMPGTFFPNSMPTMIPLDTPDPRPRHISQNWEGLPAGRFVLCSFNKHLKIDPALFQVWLSILVRVPTTVLWLLRFPAQSEDALREIANQRQYGLSSRIFFSNFVDSWEENFRRLKLADLVLDTTVYGAHTGAVDVLWAGVPLLTCMGSFCGDALDKHQSVPEEAAIFNFDHMANRVASSMLVAANLSQELVVHNMEEYFNQAARLASDQPYYDHIHAQVKAARMEALMVWDGKHYANRLTHSLQLAWENLLSGEPPRHIYADKANLLLE